MAYGIGLDGHRQLLAVTIGAEESEDSWSELLAQLLERGLSGVQLVIADAHAGIAKAVRHHLPEVPQQRCTVHLQRNVLTKGAPAPPLAAWQGRHGGLRGAEQGGGPEADGGARCRPRASRCPRPWTASGRASRRPPSSTPSPASTGTASAPPTALERLHGEIKRRTSAVGAFPDRASALRLVTAVALQVTAIWTDRRYLDMSLLVSTQQIGEAA